ncbi:collagen-like protein [Photobacterium profundum]|uniref:Uncharacterized protein n=1 Tax=Photobacterium profundum 3TCK TaxID=314280 RepID=Q1YVU4_9GAMM|nr:collagen-like protein [Photobacterium profundum]EAS40391.1 hypothetical protein P3TCK_19850 [Photobacterium profundum 3TCK]
MCRLLIVFVLFFGSLHSFAGVVAVNGQYPCNVEMPSAGALGQCYVDRVRVFGSRVLGFTRDSNKSLRLKLENGQRPWLYFSGQDDAPEPEDKYCDTAAGKSALSSAISACMDNPPMGYENTHSYSCSNQAKAILGGCNSKPIDKPCTGDACGGSGSGGDGDGGNTGGGSSGGDGGSSSGGGSSGGDSSGSGDGSKGEKGDKGDKGDTGEAGKDGVDGTNGIDGINGTNGIDGTNGNDGRDGVNGLNGTNGKDGERGAKGAKGEQGLQGIQGKDADPADLSPVLNSISSLKSFNTSEFNSATASRSKISSSLDSISELTSGLGGNIDALKISNKDALSDIKNVTSELGIKSDKQTAYQQIIAEKISLLGDDFGVGIPELDKKAETSNNLLTDIKTLTEQNSSVLTAENQAQLDKAFAQFDETQKQTDELLNIKDLTAGLGEKNDIGNEKLDGILAAIEALNGEMEVTVDNGDVVTAVDKLGNDIAASNNQLGNDITKELNALGDGIGTLTDSVDGIGETFDALAEGDFASGTEVSCGLTRNCKSYWSSSYPDGLGGVLDAFSERVKSKGFTDVLTIDLGTGSFSPKWDLCFNNIGNMSFGCFELSISDYIWGFIRAIMMFSTVLFCRSAVFGG